MKSIRSTNAFTRALTAASTAMREVGSVAVGISGRVLWSFDPESPDDGPQVRLMADGTFRATGGQGDGGEVSSARQIESLEKAIEAALAQHSNQTRHRAREQSATRAWAFGCVASRMH